MSELKTLKDFYLSIDPQFDNNPLSLDNDNLKSEAIKWIKHLRLIDCINSACTCDNCETQKWIKHFFNISEDEL